MRSESATQVLMVRSTNTGVNRATGQVLQSKISRRMAETLFIWLIRSVSFVWEKKRGPATFVTDFVDALVFGTFPDPHNGSCQPE